jgi:ArsR family transcriptional regulator
VLLYDQIITEPAVEQTAQRLLDMKAALVRAVAHPLRLAVVEYLSGGEQCVCDIADHLGAERSNVSRHLALMLKVGVVECRKHGLKVLYSLRTPCIAKFLACVSEALRERLRSEQAVLRRL